MLRFLTFLVSLSMTVALYVALNRQIPLPDGSKMIPPLGIFLNPGVGIWQNNQPDLASLDPNLRFAALKGKVNVKYDQVMVPHIFAASDHDLYFAQGYVTASNRLFQMDLITRLASGRIAEIIGEKALSTDREHRRMGMGFAAENALQAMENDPTAKAIVEAYCAGVNAYISQLSYRDYPIEYKLLHFEPEPWEPIRSFYLLKYMAKDLCFGDKDFEMTNALKKFGATMMDTLYPKMLDIQDPIVNGSTNWYNLEDVQKPTAPERNAAEIGLEVLFGIKDPDPDNGSNNWAISGKKTRSGNPILCSDPHLRLNLPSIWYAVQLSTPDGNVKGVSIPGAPTVIIGFNDSIAWAQTNARRDVVDWYKITFKDETKAEYKFDGQWLKTEKRAETIKVNGGETVYDTVLYTIHGPIVYDGESPKSGYAMRWISHDPSLEVKAIYQLNKAKNYSEYRKALENYSSPAQNFAFASASGDIAITIAGKFPNKWKDQGKYVLDGSDSLHAWQSFIPPYHHVYSLNPKRGYVSSANQHPVDRGYPYYHYDHHYEYFRNRRLNSLLDSTNQATIEDMKLIQNDNYNLIAAESLPFLLKKIKSNDRLMADLTAAEQEALDELSGWGYINAGSSIAPIYFKLWFETLCGLAYDELSDDQYLWPNKRNTIRLIKEMPNLKIFDIDSTKKKEDANDLIEMAFLSAVRSAEEWKKSQPLDLNWANYRGTRVRHLLSPMTAFHSGILKTGGDKNILNAVSEANGPSWKMIVEMDAKGAKAWGVYPGGQSGIPGNANYIDMLDRWDNGRYFKMDIRRQDDPKAFTHQQVFSK